MQNAKTAFSRTTHFDFGFYESESLPTGSAPSPADLIGMFRFVGMDRDDLFMDSVFQQTDGRFGADLFLDVLSDLFYGTYAQEKLGGDLLIASLFPYIPEDLF